MKALLAAGAVALFASGAWAESPPPAGLFQVVAAHRDSAIGNAEGLEQEDDPRLINRVVAFEHGGASFDGDAFACAKISGTTTTIPLGTLFRQVFNARAKPGYARYPMPADFGLRMSAATRVRATRFQCPRGSGGNGGEWSGRAIFPIGNGRWALAWRHDVLLILRPLPAHSPIHAGFECAKAVSPTEKAICSDPALAGWDQSISTAYASLLENSDDPGKARSEQRSWLADRATCRADKACILTKSRSRLDDLQFALRTGN